MSFVWYFSSAGEEKKTHCPAKSFDASAFSGFCRGCTYVAAGWTHDGKRERETLVISLSNIFLDLDIAFDRFSE